MRTTRTITNVNKDWCFKFDAKSVPTALPSDWERLDLPFTWNGKDGQDGGNNYKRGKGYFAKEFDREELLISDECYLEFDGVNSSADIYFNAKQIATHHGGYSTFRVRLEKNTIKDKNLLVVIADNAANNTVYPQVADFTFYGGIYRDVKLISVSKNHFDLSYFGGQGLTVTPKVEADNATILAKAYCCGEVLFEVIDKGEVIAKATANGKNPEATLKITGVRLWDGRIDPYLYTLKASLLVDGEMSDEVSARFGCRTFEVDPEKGFILNGKEYPLRGVSRHQDRPDIGNALLDIHHKQDIDLIMELGATTVRLAHYQHAQAFYDLCDEKGLVVWAEIPYISKHVPEGLENTKSQMTELIVQNYNHPCIVTWGLSNEITMSGANNKSLIENHKILNDLAHALDSTRPTTLAAVTMCPISAEYVHIPDIVAYNHYFGWYGGNTDMNGPWFDRFRKKYPDKAIGFSEYGCEGLDWHTSNPEQGDYTEEYQSYYHEELIKQIAERPYLWATHVWNMFDFASDARSEGGKSGMNHKGLVSFDRKYKKDSFYAYKAWLSNEPVLHICSKRYTDRVEDVTKVTVYSNRDEVELFANGESLGKQKKGKYPFFYFEVKNIGETELVAKSGDLADEAKIKKVDTFNESYTMKEEGAIINWFHEIDAPEGYFSINDTIGEIFTSFKGKIFLGKTAFKLKKALSENKDKADANEEGMNISGMKINKSMLVLAKGFALKRIFMMIGNKFTKEMILDINKELNKIKKPR